MAGEQAEPPMMVRRMVLNFKPLLVTCTSRPCHTVGTPAETVTPSDSNSSCRLLPSRPGPGNTSLAPTRQAEYGRPQAFTWNIGTTGSTTSRALMLSASGSAEAIVCSTVERWL
ncbi:hypothetical protein D9M69_548820 [compost metagenome]